MLTHLSGFLLGSLVSLSQGLPATAPAPSPPNSVIQFTPNQPRMIRIAPPTLRTCAVALRALPSFQDTGEFHAGGPADMFRLPVTQIYGSCTVVVELAGGHRSEMGSWMEVGLAANQLNMECVDSDANPATMGGGTICGRTNGVVVKIRETLMSGNWTIAGR